jgi:hypothetical protein
VGSEKARKKLAAIGRRFIRGPFFTPCHGHCFLKGMGKLGPVFLLIDYFFIPATDLSNGEKTVGKRTFF